MESSWQQPRSLRLSWKALKIGLGVSSISGIATIMTLTNPGQAAYERYATQKVIGLLNQNVCAEAPKSFNLRRDCQDLLKTHRDQIQEFIAKNTERQDFVLFSVYTTDVAIASFLPKYRVETVGAFRQFHIYDTADSQTNL